MAYFVFAFDNPSDNNAQIGFTLIPDTGELISDTWVMPASMKNATSSSTLVSLLPTSGSAWTRNGVTIYYDSTKIAWSISAGSDSWFFYDCPDGDGNTVEQCLNGTANLTYSGGAGVGKCAYNFGCGVMFDNIFQYANGNRVEWNEIPARVCGLTENYLPSLYHGTDSNDVDTITYRVWVNSDLLASTNNSDASIVVDGAGTYVNLRVRSNSTGSVGPLSVDSNYFEFTYSSSLILQKWNSDIINTLDGNKAQHIDVECYLPHVCAVYLQGSSWVGSVVGRCFTSMLKNRYWKSGVDNDNTYGLVDRDSLAFHENVANSTTELITLLDFPTTESVGVRPYEVKRRLNYTTQSTLVWLESSDGTTFLPSSTRSVNGPGTYKRLYVCDGFVCNPDITMCGYTKSGVNTINFYGITAYGMKVNSGFLGKCASTVPVSFYASGTTVVDKTPLTVNFMVGDGIRSKEVRDDDGDLVYLIDKVQDYDGSTALLYSDPSLTPSELLAGHTDVQVSASVPPIKKMAGLQTVSVVFTLTGSDAGLYSVESPVLYSVYVEPKHVTVNAFVADKYYDGTTRADLVIDTVSGVVRGDDVKVAGYRYDGNASSTNAVVFPSSNVGTYNLQVKYVLTGADADNYVITYSGNNPYVGLSGEIKSFTVTTNVVGVSYKVQN